METYSFILKELRVQNAASFNNLYCVGFPALSSFAGYADAVTRHVADMTGKHIESQRFSVIVHDAQHHHGVERHVRYMQFERENAGNSPPSMKQEYKADLTVTLFIEVDVEKPDVFDSVETSFVHRLNEQIDALNDVLTVTRVAGGTVLNEEDVIEYHREPLETSLMRAKWLRPGYFMTSASELFRDYQAMFDGDSLKAILHACTLYEGNESAWTRAQRGWVTPSNVGYVGITEPHPIAGGRDDTAMVYAEPITGLVEYIFARRLLRKAKADAAGALNRAIFTSRYRDHAYLVESLSDKQA